MIERIHVCRLVARVGFWQQTSHRETKRMTRCAGRACVDCNDSCGLAWVVFLEQLFNRFRDRQTVQLWQFFL